MTGQPNCSPRLRRHQGYPDNQENHDSQQVPAERFPLNAFPSRIIVPCHQLIRSIANARKFRQILYFFYYSAKICDVEADKIPATALTAMERRDLSHPDTMNRFSLSVRVKKGDPRGPYGPGHSHCQYRNCKPRDNPLHYFTTSTTMASNPRYNASSSFRSRSSRSVSISRAGRSSSRSRTCVRIPGVNPNTGSQN